MRADRRAPTKARFAPGVYQSGSTGAKAGARDAKQRPHDPNRAKSSIHVERNHPPDATADEQAAIITCIDEICRASRSPLFVCDGRVDGVMDPRGSSDHGFQFPSYRARQLRMRRSSSSFSTSLSIALSVMAIDTFEGGAVAQAAGLARAILLRGAGVSAERQARGQRSASAQRRGS
jgi:hypothetical protein